MKETQAAENRKAARSYWHSYLNDGHLMGWLTVDADGNLGSVYEPQGQIYYCGDNEVLHSFGDAYRAHGRMPRKMTFEAFAEHIGVGKYLSAETPAGSERTKFSGWLSGLVKPEYNTERFVSAAWAELLRADEEGRSFELEARYTILGRPYLYGLS